MYCEVKPKAKYKADLHCHTTASDGILTPAEIVRLADERGLRALAITDHDTIEGWVEAEKFASQVGLRLIKGLEINTDWKGKEIHILGYGPGKEKGSLERFLEELRRKRVDRIEEILAKLSRLNIHLSLTEVKQYAKGQSIGRPHVVQAMMAKGYVSTYQEGFEKYLKIGAPAYVPRAKLTPTEAISIIREAGGVAVLAHPGNNVSQEEIQKWIEDGLQGIEISHPDHTPNQKKKYERLAFRNGLLATGGSDYHGPRVKPGVELGDWGVDLELVDQLEQLIISSRL
ncbi:MAG TPA: PHP domain-containing protein [Peptococcaceae bacterium]|nr:PHP domain-containing protein [Peptococcaceae bacterium]